MLVNVYLESDSITCILCPLSREPGIKLHTSCVGLIEAIMAVLIHPCQAARLAAAWCLRCICVAVPSQITPLIDRLVLMTQNITMFIFICVFTQLHSESSIIISATFVGNMIL